MPDPTVGPALEERELKFPVSDPGPIRDRLIELGAHCCAEASRESNAIFDRNGEIYPSGKALRLRTDGGGARLTFKGPASYEGGVKVRREIETGVSDAEAMHALLEALGYERVTGYEKIREEWRFGQALVALDQTPIGDFVEVEGSDPVASSHLLDLDVTKSEPRSYLALYRDYRLANPQAPAEMRFP